jgi:hypothetical protein
MTAPGITVLALLFLGAAPDADRELAQNAIASARNALAQAAADGGARTEAQGHLAQAEAL